ncbi:MAG: hypothetical protein WCY25_06920 [Moheibacter sp.]
MNIEATKLELLQLLLNTKNESILLKIKSIYDEESVDWWKELSEQERQEIEEGLTEAGNGQIVSHESVMKRFDSWK